MQNLLFNSKYFGYNLSKMVKKIKGKIKDKIDNFVVSKIHKILLARKIDYVLKEVQLVEKFSDDRKKYRLIYEVVGELREREEIVIIDGGEEDIDTPDGGGDNGQGGGTDPKPLNKPEWEIYTDKVANELRKDFSQQLATGLNNLKNELLQVINENNEQTNKKIDENNQLIHKKIDETNKRIDGIEDTLKQILSILKDKK
ncbi:hypothetical protein CJJ23_03620 [Mycoplasmopsis agassizii]|uniref:Uncharacterized protein n=1 Tax=Mycoplasmopsis agassizii TaxID=33922 RepID=A0A269TJC1_9BACT|nr:hypothetical protein [Mycoplasmopsis agassizii]PAK21126.1 hypothetical protein CJJ23_03620 [Mycoplasmopsis agassizii]